MDPAATKEAGIEVGVRTLAGTTTIVMEEAQEVTEEVTVQEEVIKIEVKEVDLCAEVLPTEEATEEIDPPPIL